MTDSSRIAPIRTSYSIVDAREKGIGFPFLNAQEGMFSRRFGLDVLVDDILAIIHIIPGEYPNDPELGVGISRWLFEMADASLSIQLEDVIEKQVLKYIKDIVLIGVEVDAISEEKVIDITVRFKKVEGSRDIIRINNKISTDQNTLEAGIEAA